MCEAGNVFEETIADWFTKLQVPVSKSAIRKIGPFGLL